VAEIKDSATKQRFEVVPYEIQFRQPYPEYIQLGMDYGMDYRINDGNFGICNFLRMDSFMNSNNKLLGFVSLLQ
jgi:hypothetical protein